MVRKFFFFFLSNSPQHSNLIISNREKQLFTFEKLIQLIGIFSWNVLNNEYIINIFTWRTKWWAVIVSDLNTTCNNTEVELHSFSSSLGYFYKHISTTHNASRRLLREDCSSGLLSCSRLCGHNTCLWTIDTCITTPDQSERNILLPWQQHYSLPHILLAVRSLLKGMPRVTDRVIYHTCHLVQRLLLSMQQLWSARCKNRAATCFCQA